MQMAFFLHCQSVVGFSCSSNTCQIIITTHATVHHNLRFTGNQYIVHFLKKKLLKNQNELQRKKNVLLTKYSKDWSQFITLFVLVPCGFYSLIIWIIKVITEDYWVNLLSCLKIVQAYQHILHLARAWRVEGLYIDLKWNKKWHFCHQFTNSHNRALMPLPSPDSGLWLLAPVHDYLRKAYFITEHHLWIKFFAFSRCITSNSILY